MALKDDWKDLVDGVDDASSDSINKIAHAVIDMEENGGGGSGEDGGYYIPEIDLNGVLYWTPSKETMPEVPAFVVKGKDGRGIDTIECLENGFIFVTYTDGTVENIELKDIPVASLEGVVYVDKENLVGGTYTNNLINTDGTLTANANWALWDDVITVPNPGNSTIYRLNNIGTSTIVLYREDGTIYTRKSLAAGADKSYTITNTSVTKVRITEQITNLTNGQTWAWEEVTEFVPYGAKPGYNYDGNPMYADLDKQIEEVNDKVQNVNNLKLNILCLGDSIFGNDGEIVSYLAQFTGATVTNGAIGGTRASVRVSDTDAFQYLDGKNLVQALTSGDWTDQDSAVTSLGESYPWLPGRIDTLKSVDMSKVDLVTMDWGTNDYTGGQTVNTIVSAYNDIIDMLQSAYPELRILITTPIWRYFSDTENGDNKVYKDETLKEIAEAIETFAKEKRVHVLNAYQNMPLNYNTASTYFDTGSDVHLNKKGNELYAHLLNGKIRSLY